ncbi:MAG TPA: MFS transporter [Solirubrobacteraceae bacterium]|jgi:MFS family permease|nr:MFS transporter [Solirubrobacteraceae bacterium]
MTSYRSVLSIPGSARLYASGLLARLPQGMGSLALLLLVHASTRSYAAAGVAVGAYALATAAMAPVQGRLVDRFGRMRILAPSGVGQGAAFVAVVLVAHAHAPAAVLVLLCGLAGGLQPPFAATVRAMLRDVVRDPGTRESAYALESVAQELIWITGPLIVAVVISATSDAGAVLVVAAFSVIGALVFVTSPLARAGVREVAHSNRRAALASRALRALLLPVVLTGVSLGAIEVGIPSLALHAGARWASGLLLALWSVGSIAGGLWYGSRSWRIPLSARYRNLLAAGVLCTAPLIVARSVPAGVVASLLAGLTTAPMFSCQYALVGRTVTAGSETEAFAWVAAALVSGIAAGSAAGGAVIGALGVSAPFVLSCLAIGSAAGLALRAQDAHPEAQVASLDPGSRSSTPVSSS